MVINKKSILKIQTLFGEKSHVLRVNYEKAEIPVNA